MKILHIIFAFPNGGKENLLVDCVNLQSTNNNVSLWIINKYVSLDLVKRIEDTVDIVLFNRTPKSKSIITFSIMNIKLLFNNPDIIHTHDVSIINIFPLFQKHRFFTTVHSTNLYESTLIYYNKIFAISEAVKLDIINSENYLKEKVILVPNGIHFNKIKKKLNYKLGGLLKLIQVGRLKFSEKGQDISIELMKILKDNCIKANLTLIGDGLDHKYLIEKINNLGLNNDVQILSSINRLWIYDNLYKYDVLLVPSRIEGFGLSAVEGLAAKLPIIVSNVGGLKDINDHLNNKLYVAEPNPCSFFSEVIRLLESYNKNLIEKETEKLFVEAKKLYDISDMVTKYYKHYIGAL